MAKFFNISEAANIAIHSLALISTNEHGLSSTQISETFQFSRNHVAKVLQLLTKFRLVTSTRGPKGGFKLMKPASSISLFEVIEFIDGKIVSEHCRGDSMSCHFEECIYGDERQRLFEEFKKYYTQRTIANFTIKSENNEKKHH